MIYWGNMQIMDKDQPGFKNIIVKR